MSIYDELSYLVSQKRLFFLNPAMSGEEIVRRMYVSEEINSMIMGPTWEDAKWEENCGILRRDFDRFITGRRISVRRPPSRNVTSLFALLEPPNDDVWEIRSRDPTPQLRVFGRFAMTDMFVALTWWKRPDLESQWRYAREECKTEWSRLFPAYRPISGANIRDCISTKYFLV